MAETTTNRRFRPRFTLAALLALITVVAIPLGYVSQRRAWNLKRKAVLKSFQEWRIGIESQESSYPPTNESGFNNWLRQLYLDDQATEIRTVFSHPRQATDYQPAAEEFSRLLAFPETESLELSAFDNLTDEVLEKLIQLPNLTELRIIDAPGVTGKFLRKLPAESKLQSLYFGRTAQLDGAELKNLAKLNSLRSLWFHSCPTLSDQALKEVDLPGNIDDLLVNDCPIGAVTLSRWLSSHQFQRLSLEGCLTRAAAAALATQTQLEQLRITNSPLIDDDLHFLTKTQQLVLLRLEAMPVRGDFLGGIPHPEKLVYLQLSSTLLNDLNVKHLDRFKNLQTVDLNWNPISGEGFQSLGPFLNLWKLQLNGTQFSDDGKTALAGIRSGPMSPFGVDLPANWSIADLARFPGGVPPWNITFDSRLVLEMRQRDGANFGFNTPGGKSYPSCSTPRQSLHVEWDKCPTDLMAPVIRLHELDRANDNAQLKAAEDFMAMP